MSTLQERKLKRKKQKLLYKLQRMEITEYYIYNALAKRTRNEHNKKLLAQIANEEKQHYEVWKKYSGRDIPPSNFGVFCGVVMTYTLGCAFTLRWMEKLADRNFFPKKIAILKEDIPEVDLVIMVDEKRHEEKILEFLDQNYIKFIGSVVLGLNDALVEMVGSLAGFTLAYQNARLVLVTGFITGTAATLSMAASEYLSLKSEKRNDALLASILTGLAYYSVVLCLLLPYLIIPHNVNLALGFVIVIVLIIIAAFNYFVTTVQGSKFWPRFAEMAIISLSVAFISFIIGYFAKIFLNINI